MTQPWIVAVPPEMNGLRLDAALAALMPRRSRAAWQDAIGSGYVSVEGRPARAAQRVRGGQEIGLTLPEVRPHVVPSDLVLPIIYQDDDLVVLDKPAGMVVHPAPGWSGATLVDALLRDDLVTANDEGDEGDEAGEQSRPGIVHRLDKDTSGLLVVARHRVAQAHLAAQFKERTIRKRYWALVDGHPHPAAGAVEAPIGRDPRYRARMAVVAGGRAARTTYRTRRLLPNHALLDIGLETGRTHQIRVHMAAIGHPVAGDGLYGAHPVTIPLGRQYLHAYHLELDSPSTGERLSFESALPPELAAIADLE